jgi:REP element-mobilizing transposase RayT
VLPGITYLVTRRCTHRQLLLRPSETTNGIFKYVLAVAAERYGVQVHAFCVMSNHFHLVVTDPHARLPAFEQYLASLVARAVNASLARSENLWDPRSFSAVVLADPDDVIEKAAYVLANPVAAGLVERAEEWPGLWSDLDDGNLIEASRPEMFFRPGGPTPDRAVLELVSPPGFVEPEEFRRRVHEALRLREDEARRTLAADGRRFLGRVLVLAQRPTARPSSPKVSRELSPRVAARDKWTRLEVLGRLKRFADEYRHARARFTGGERTAVFPAGTYALRVVHGVECAAA